jgi:hypothetical protein
MFISDAIARLAIKKGGGFKARRIFEYQFVLYLTISPAFTKYGLKRRGCP